MRRIVPVTIARLGFRFANALLLVVSLVCPYASFTSVASGQLTREQARADLDELALRLEDQFAYLELRDVGWRAALDRMKAGLPERVDVGVFARDLQRFMAAFGDGHASVSSGAWVRPKRYPPFLLIETTRGVVAVRPDRRQFLNDANPYVLELDGRTLGEWIEAVRPEIAAGSEQLVRRRSLRALREPDRFREAMDIPRAPRIRCSLTADPAHGIEFETWTPMSERRPVFGPWPRTESGRLEGDVGYLRVPAMDEEFEPEIRRAMADFKDTTALIVDVRGNGGGSRSLLLAFAGYLLGPDDAPWVGNVGRFKLSDRFDDDHLSHRFMYRADDPRWTVRQRAVIAAFANDFVPEWEPVGAFSAWHYLVLDRTGHPDEYHYDRPVIVLSDAGCFSATDIFLGALAGRPGVTLTGSASSGGSARSQRFTLTHSAIRIRCASMASFRPDGRMYDGRGVAVDIDVATLPTDFLLDGTDRVLEAALASCVARHPGDSARAASHATDDPDDGVSFVTMHEAELRDRIAGAWLGQMIGVTWGFPTEFYGRYIWQLFPRLHQVDGAPQNIYVAYEGGPIPLDTLPSWTPDLINGGYTQDDLYVEVPFMETLATHGVNASWTALGETFAASRFPLYHANAVARRNLRAGIVPPASGHYRNGGESDDIDWQIEADFVGLMNPGQPHSAAEIAFRAGHVMNYGDGVYGGVFVATMIAEAFTAESVRAIAEAGRDAVPDGSAYRAVIDQVFIARDRGDDYATALGDLYARWGDDDRCAEWGGAADPLNIDAKLNGSFILLGLLYGEGDLAASMRLAMAAGQDSDCNPSNVGSILGAFLGREALAADDPQWLAALDTSRRFQTTPHTLDALIELNVELARSVVQFKGGDAPRGGPWRLPVRATRERLILEQWPRVANDPPVLTASAVAGRDRTVRVSASARDADGIAGYQWFFGDLTFSSGREHVHTYARAGSYELIAYTTDRTGNTSCQVINVTVD